MSSDGNICLAEFFDGRFSVSIDREGRRLRISERIIGMPAETHAEMTPEEWLKAAGAWAEKTGQLYKQTETEDYVVLGQKTYGCRWKVLDYNLTKAQADVAGSKWAEKGRGFRQYRVVRVEYTGKADFDR